LASEDLERLGRALEAAPDAGRQTHLRSDCLMASRAVPSPLPWQVEGERYEGMSLVIDRERAVLGSKWVKGRERTSPESAVGI